MQHGKRFACGLFALALAVSPAMADEMFALADPVTESESFTGADQVKRLRWAAPDEATHYQITLGTDPAGLTGEWVPVATEPAAAFAFDRPADGTVLTWRAWFTNDQSAAAMVTLDASITYTEARPTARVFAVLPAPAIQGTPTAVTPAAADNGSDGGETATDVAVPIFARRLRLLSGPAPDATPDAPGMSLSSCGDYQAELIVQNAAGAIATSGVFTVRVAAFADITVPSNTGVNTILASTYTSANWSGVRAFDNSLPSTYYDAWESDVAANPLANGIWVSYTFKTGPRAVNSYSVTAGGTLYTAGSTPRAWRLEGSNTVEGGWVQLDARDSEGGWSNRERRFYAFENTNAYATYRVTFTNNNGSATRLHVNELEFFTANATLTVAGAPAKYGSPSPGYGLHEGLAFETALSATAGETTVPLADGTRAVFLGYDLTNRTDLSSGSDPSFTYVHTNDATLVWLWQRQHVFSATAAAHGTLSEGGSTNGWYDEFGTVTATAAADAGWQFAFWQGDVPAAQATNATVSLNMDRPRTLQAIFVETGTTPVTRTFTGADGAGWHEAGSWTPEGIPGAGDTVVFTNNAAVTLHLAGATARLAGLVISNALNKTTTLCADTWGARIDADDILVGRGGVISCAGGFDDFSEYSNRVWIVCDTLAVAAGGAIQADAKGYRGSTLTNGCGPGGGWWNSGGSYGGLGGVGLTYSGFMRFPYGSHLDPAQPGSGGGSGSAEKIGGSGGGAIWIEAAGHVQLDGALSANGGNQSGPGNGLGGGGSGGAIYLRCETITGAGTLTAKGGTMNFWGGNGSGGRIAVHYDTTAQAGLPKPALSFSALPGVLSGQTYETAQYNGEPGTLYLPDDALLTEPINVTAQIYFPEPRWHTEALTLIGQWVVFPQDGFALEVDGDLTVCAVGNVGRLDLGGCVLTNTVSLNSGGAWNGFRRFGGACASSLWVGGDFVVTNTYATCVIRAAATNGTVAECGATVQVGRTLRTCTGAWIHPVSHALHGGRVTFGTRNLQVATNSGFNATGQGFFGGVNVAYKNLAVTNWNGLGPGGGWLAASSYLTRGGSYGGRGGNVTDNKYLYGDPDAPIFPGSGGTSDGLSGGFGGGVIEIAASGDTMLAGVLRADGFTPGGGHYSGGSGGSIYLRANRFRAIGGAVVSANGSGGGGSGGGGGGGRVAFWRRRDLTVDYTLAPTANYGVGGAAGTVGSVITGLIPDPATVIFLR